MNGRIRRFVRRPLLLVSTAVVAVALAMAFLSPIIAPHDPAAQDLARAFETPSADSPLGRDALGRDILSRIVYGSRVSLAVGFAAVSVSLAIGTLLGALAGTLGGWAEEVVMRVIDLLMAFPGLLLAIAMVGFLGPGLDNVMIALVSVGWVSYARLTRGQVLVLREADFVLAARSLGAGPWRLITRHLLPNLLTPLIVEATFGMAGVIIAEAGLSFLGLGVQPPTASWGSMLAEGRQFILVAPHLTVAPGVAIMLVVMALNLLGDDLRDILDPKGRA